MIYPETAQVDLGFDTLLDRLKGLFLSDLGSIHLKQLELPAEPDPELINLWLSQVAEFKSLLDGGRRFPADNYLNIKDDIENLNIPDFALALSSFLRIQLVANTITEIHDFLAKQDPEALPFTKEILRQTPSEPLIDKEISRVIDPSSGEVRSSASPELQRLRKESISVRKEIDRAFRRVQSDYKKKGYLSDPPETIRGGRRVLAVKAENKRMVNGIIHDESETGKTSFIEPAPSVQLSNKLFEVEREEKREIYKILKELTETLSIYKELLSAYVDTLGLIDFIRAKARLAVAMEAYKPIITNEPELSIQRGFHPILLMLNRPAGKTTVPLNLELDHQSRILIISGPNAGGKSVSLKTIGLFQLMLRHGMLIPADANSRIYPFRSLFTDIGDAQSIEDELSTYSSRLKRIKTFIDGCDGQSLFLIDEFGTGTDPKLGGAMAEALLDSLQKTDAFGVVTTHYGNLKSYASKKKGVMNGAMIFDEEHLTPTFQLETGKPGSSFTFAIAQKSGIPKAIINRASKLSDKGTADMEHLLRQLQKDKQELQTRNDALLSEDRELKKMMKQLQSISAELEKQKQQLQYELKMKKKEELQIAESRIREVLREIEQSESKKKAATAAERKLKEDQQKVDKDIDKLRGDLVQAREEQEIEAGSTVRLFDGSQPGTVLKLEGKSAVVAFGQIRSKVKLDKLVLIEPPKGAEKSQSRPMVVVEHDSSLDLRGMRRDEALSALERFMDQALIGSLSFLKIIHGKGDGILRKAVRQNLKQYKDIKEIRSEEDRYGGDGVTIVEL